MGRACARCRELGRDPGEIERSAFGVDEVYSCAGDVDLIAMVKVARHEELADVIAGRLSKVDGVRRTDTHIAFRSWARADTEATFDVGLES